MPDFDIDKVLSNFGETSKAASSNFDVDSILSEFGGSKDRPTVADKVSAITIRTPKPPISGISKEASDELNQTRTERFGGENPRNKLPTTNIQDTMAEHGIAAKDLLASAADDFQTSHPYKGIGKTALGLVSAVAAPFTGAIEGSVNKIADQLFPKGNQDIPRYPDPIYGTPTGMPLETIASTGDRAGFIASSAIPLGPAGKAANAARPTNKALKNLIENIGSDNLPAVVSAMKANPRLAPADLSPRVLQDAQHLFANDGKQIDYLANTSSARLANTKDTVNNAFDASMGATVNAAKKVADLTNAAREIGKKNIEPILTSKPHTDVTDLIKHIDKEIGYPAMKAIKEGKQPPLPLTDYQRELLNVRNKLRNPEWPDRDKMFAYTDQVHDAQIKLREKAQGLTGSAAGSERNTGKELLGFREKLKDAVGPEYKEALSKYAGQKKVEEAFHNGYDTILSNSKKLENDPSFFEKWVNSSARKPGELEAAREGARLRIEAEIKGARTAATNPAAKAIGIGQTEFSVQRLEALLGKEEATKLLKTLDDERKIANTHNKIIEGSQTAMRNASKSQFAMPTATEAGKTLLPLAVMEGSNILAGGIGGVGSAIYGGARVAHAAKDRIKMLLAKEHNAQYAKYALPTEGPSRDALIQSLEAAIPGPKQSIIRRGANSLSRLVSP